jgi:hypothetical protein
MIINPYLSRTAAIMLLAYLPRFFDELRHLEVVLAGGSFVSERWIQCLIGSQTPNPFIKVLIRIKI